MYLGGRFGAQCRGQPGQISSRLTMSGSRTTSTGWFEAVWRRVEHIAGCRGRSAVQCATLERSEARRGGHYERKLQTKAGEVTLRIPNFRRRRLRRDHRALRRRDNSVEEALIETYLAGELVRRVEDITEALWGTRVSPSRSRASIRRFIGRSRPSATGRLRASTLRLPGRHRAQAQLGRRSSQCVAVGGDRRERRGFGRFSASAKGPRRTKQAGAASSSISRNAA